MEKAANALTSVKKVSIGLATETIIPQNEGGLFAAEHDDEHGCRVEYVPSLFNALESADLLEQLVNTTAWQQDHLTMYGKTTPLPRLTAWYGDPGSAYTYSGIRMEPHPWSRAIRAVKDRVESICGELFNSVLLNQYRHGKDGVSWHSDDESELGSSPLIASVSFGQTRAFKLRRKPHEKGNKSLAVELTSGSCIVMSGRTQELWEHEIPKTAKSGIGPRVNLTFRQVASG